jgi:hypothetical protein
LSIGANNSISASVNTREVLVIAQAALEDTVDIGSRSVIRATNTIKDMLAVVSGIWTSRITSLETEHIGSHEVVPFDNLLIMFKITGVGRESVRE